MITVGDYNGFEFSDGFVDVLGVTKGNPVPASQVVTTPLAGIANPVLTDLVTLLPAAQRQSYVEVGSAQVLDHVVVTADLVPLETGLVYAHIDSDYPLVYENDATRPERVSDHDPAVAYFTLPPAPAPAVTLASTAVAFGSVTVGTTATQTVKLTDSGNGALAFTSITATGAGYAQTNDCSTGIAAGSFCTITATFTPGSSAALTGSVSIVSNATSSPDAIGLSGTGVAPIVTLSGTTLAFGSQLVGTPATKTVTLTNSGTAPLAVTLHRGDRRGVCADEHLRYECCGERLLCDYGDVYAGEQCGVDGVGEYCEQCYVQPGCNWVERNRGCSNCDSFGHCTGVWIAAGWDARDEDGDADELWNGGAGGYLHRGDRRGLCADEHLRYRRRGERLLRDHGDVYAGKQHGIGRFGEHCKQRFVQPECDRFERNGGGANCDSLWGHTGVRGRNWWGRPRRRR